MRDGTTVSRCLPLEVEALDEVGRFYYPYDSNSWPAAEWELLNNDRYWQRDREQGSSRSGSRARGRARSDLT